eukprot:gene15774-17366_t
MEDFALSSGAANLSGLLDKYLNELPSTTKSEDSILTFLKLMLDQIPNGNFQKCLLKLEDAVGSDRSFFIINGLLIVFDHFYDEKYYQLCLKIAQTTMELYNSTIKQQDIGVLDHFSPLIFKESMSKLNTEVMLRLSSSYLQTDKCKKSIILAQECFKQGKEGNDKILQLRCLVLLGNAFWKEKCFKEALLQNHLLLQTGRSLDVVEVEESRWNNQLECQALWNLSACYSSLGSMASALKYAEEYLQVIEYSSQQNMTKIYSYIGSLHYELQDFDSALTSHEAEMAICKKYNDRIGMAAAYGSLGLIYSATGQIQLGNEFLLQEMKMAKALKHSDLELSGMQKFAMARMKSGDKVAAIDAFKSVYQLAREVHDWNKQCLAYINIGKLYQQQGTLNFARHYLEQGMNRANDLHIKKEAINAEMHLAQVLKILGYQEDARRHFKEVILYLENTLDTIHRYEVILDSNIVRDLQSCCKHLQEVLIKLNYLEDALEIAELHHSRIHVNIMLKRKTVCSNEVEQIFNVPRTSPEIFAALRRLPSNTTVLFYTVTTTGYLLWMLKPREGLKKFVKYDSLPSQPIDKLVRDCLRSLGVSKKGGACCYKTAYRKKLAHQWMPKHVSRKPCGKSSTTVGSEKPLFTTTGFVKDVSTSINEESFSRESSTCLPCIQSKEEKAKSMADTSHPTSEDRELSSLCKESQISKDGVVCQGEKCDFGFQDGLVARSKEKCIRSSETGENHNELGTFAASGGSSESYSRVSTCTETTQQSHNALLTQLFKVLLGKVEHLLPSSCCEGNESLIVVPDGILNTMPFHLLVDKYGNALHQRFNVTVLPCLALLNASTACNDNDEDDGDDCVDSDTRGGQTDDFCKTSLVFGNPCLQEASLRNENGDVLSWRTEDMESEMQLVSRILGCHRYFSGKMATKEDFVYRLSSADNDIIHIATHGSNTKGCLLFTPNPHRYEAVAERSSYVFDLDDLAQLTLGAKLVVLSSCEQCPHGVADCREFQMNLANGFLSVGAVAVVMFLYAMPHDALKVIIHKLYRLLEEGHSVSQSLQIIYTTMSNSKDHRHPGYWGGIVHVGRDAKLDIHSMRKNELKRTIDEGTSSLQLGTVPGRNEERELKIFLDAKDVQMHLATFLQMNDNLIYLETLKDLLTVSIKEIESFGKYRSISTGKKAMPTVAINQDLIKATNLRNFLIKLGFEVQKSIFENDVTLLMLPAWDFDGILDNVLTLVTCAHEICSISASTAFCLSQIMLELSRKSLDTLRSMLTVARMSPELPIHLSEPRFQYFWATTKTKRLLEHVGFYDIGTDLYLNTSKSYSRIQNAMLCLVDTLITLYKKNKNLDANEYQKLQQSCSEKFNSFMPWFAIRPTEHKNSEKQKVAKSLHAIIKQLHSHSNHARQWHDATLQSWKSTESNKIFIGPDAEKPETCERYCNGTLKVKVKPGGTPSSCRLPVVEKPKVSKFQCYKLREELENIFINRTRILHNRKRYEVCKSYSS